VGGAVVSKPRNPANRAAWEQGRLDALEGRPADPAAGADAPDEFAYDRGYQAGLEEAPDAPEPTPKRRTSSPAKRRPAGRNGSGSKRSRSSSRRRSSRTSRTVRQLGRPVASATANAVGVVGAAIAIAALYNALNNADAIGGFLGGIGRGIAWLDDPNTSIPYRSNP
jgi:hypothetical protein